MDKELTFTQMGRSTLVIERRTDKMEWGQSFGLMVLTIKDCIQMERDVDWESSHFQMHHFMKENFKMIVFMGKGSISGRMGGNMKEHGLKTKCMVFYFFIKIKGLELLIGQMAGYILAIIKMIKSMGKGNFLGLMENLIMGNDLMENSMGLESIPIKNKKQKKENGQKVREFGGCNRIPNQFLVLDRKVFINIECDLFCISVFSIKNLNLYKKSFFNLFLIFY